MMFSPPHYEEVGRDHFQRHVLEKARCYHSASHESCRRASLHSRTITAWASSRAWPGRTGSSDRAVYLALCERMRMDGGMPFRASVREVMELAGVAKMTANRSLKRLKATGLIHLDTKTGINNVTLILPEDFSQQRADRLNTVGVAYTPVRVSVSIELTNHDAWHRNALGKSALACWSQLVGSQGMTEAELTTHTGRCRITVKRALERLMEYRLVERRESGLWHGVTASQECLDQIAADKKTRGRAALRVARNSDERAKWASKRIAKQIESRRRAEGKCKCLNKALAGSTQIEPNSASSQFTHATMESRQPQYPSP